MEVLHPETEVERIWGSFASLGTPSFQQDYDTLYTTRTTYYNAWDTGALAAYMDGLQSDKAPTLFKYNPQISWDKKT